MNKLLLEKEANIKNSKNYMRDHVECKREYIEQINEITSDETKNTFQKIILKSKLNKERENNVRCYNKIADRLISINDSKLIFYIGSSVHNEKTRDYCYAFDKDRVSYIERSSKLGKIKERVAIIDEINADNLLNHYNIRKIMIELNNYVEYMIKENDFQTWDELRTAIIQDLSKYKNISSKKESFSTKKEEALEL